MRDAPSSPWEGRWKEHEHQAKEDSTFSEESWGLGQWRKNLADKNGSGQIVDSDQKSIAKHFVVGGGTDKTTINGWLNWKMACWNSDVLHSRRKPGVAPTGLITCQTSKRRHDVVLHIYIYIYTNIFCVDVLKQSLLNWDLKPRIIKVLGFSFFRIEV